MNDLRSSIMAQQDLIGSKRRFGLFSQLPPLAVGDDGAYRHKKPNIGQNGKPITNPPQMLGGPARSGLTKSAYFLVPSSILLNDPYKQYNKKMHTRSKMHQAQFNPTSVSSILAKSSYMSMDQNPQSGKKRTIIRDETGKVKTGQRNFTTNPIKKVQSQFFKPYKYMPDPLQKKQQLQKKQRELFKSKLQQGNFNSVNYGGKLFNKDSSVFGQDAKSKLLLKEKAMKSPSKSTLSRYQHDSPFIPARRGHGDPIAKYPRPVEKSTRQSISPRKQSKQQDGRQKWVPNNHGYSRPTPSISLNPTNLNLRKLK